MSGSRINQGASRRAIARYALQKLGAELAPVHTEDIAVECFKLAPDLFALERYPEYPRVDTAYYALKNLKPTGDVSGGLRDGWTLTRQGSEWIEENEAFVRQFLGTPVESRMADAASRADLDRVRTHKAFQDYARGREHRPSRQELADMLGCTVGSLPATWQARFARLHALAKSEDTAVERFLGKIEEYEPELLRGVR